MTHREKLIDLIHKHTPVIYEEDEKALVADLEALFEPMKEGKLKEGER